MVVVPMAHPSHHPKQYLDRFSRFCMGHKCYAVQCNVNGEENPQNCFFPLGLRHPDGGKPSYGHRQHEQKCGIYRACGSRDMLADRLKDTQTYSIQYFTTAPAGEVITTYSLSAP